MYRSLSQSGSCSQPQPVKAPDKDPEMTENVYSVSEIVGSSANTVEDAIGNALERARKTLRNLDWFEVTEIRGRLNADGTVECYQVTLKLGFRMED